MWTSPYFLSAVSATYPGQQTFRCLESYLGFQDGKTTDAPYTMPETIDYSTNASHQESVALLSNDASHATLQHELTERQQKLTRFLIEHAQDTSIQPSTSSYQR